MYIIAKVPNNYMDMLPMVNFLNSSVTSRKMSTDNCTSWSGLWHSVFQLMVASEILLYEANDLDHLPQAVRLIHTHSSPAVLCSTFLTFQLAIGWYHWSNPRSSCASTSGNSFGSQSVSFCPLNSNLTYLSH